MAKFARTLTIFVTFLYARALPAGFNEKSPRTILSLMSENNDVCKFPPREVLQSASEIISIAPCAKQIPHTRTFGDGLEGIRQYAMEVDDSYAFLCMGFYDLSIQICNSTLPEEVLVKDTTQFTEMFDDSTRDSQFCKDISSYLPFNRNANSDENFNNWIQVLDEYLAKPEDCHNFCISRGKVLPICRILFWGRKLLHDFQHQLSAKRSNVAASHTGNLNGATQEILSPSTDLEAQNIDGTDDHGIPPVETNNSESAKSGVPTLETLFISKEEVEEKPKQDLNSTSNVVVEVSPTSKSTPAVVVIPRDDQKSVEEKQPAIEVEKSSSFVPTNASTTSTTETPQSSADIAETVPSENESILTGMVDSGVPEYSTLQQDLVSINPEDDDDDDDDVRIQEPAMPQENERSQSLSVDMEAPFRRFNSFSDAEDSHFFAYFLTLAVICIFAYLVFHNKNKILALALEGRRSKGGRTNGRRPSTSSYRKLDSTLEEAITSSAPRTNPHVIY